MKRATLVPAFLACGCLAMSGVLFAQDAADKPPAAPKAAYWSNWFNAETTLLLLGHSDVTSSKFQEYRDVAQGVSVPAFTLRGSHNGKTVALFGQNLSRTDQQYSGRASVGWFGVKFAYSQIPHNMGNGGFSIMNNTAPGVWSMSASLRQALQTAVENQPTAGRTWDFYSSLYAPTIAAASRIDLVALRKRGSIEFDLGNTLPFSLAVTYSRDVKTGTRGPGGGYVRGFIDNVVQIPEGLDELTQDIGFKALVDRKWGNVHGTIGHNWYIDRMGTTVVDNPVRAFDQVYVAASGPTPATGGGARARFINPPNNEADTGSVGVLLKFRRQTRIGADVTRSRWTQTAQFYPYTINSTVLTPSGVPANSLSALPFQHLDGKIDTTTVNLSLASRPAKGFGVRARYRTYDLSNRTPAIARLGYVSLDRAWTSATISADQPLGYPTADPYGYGIARFDVSASYDLNALTLDAGYHRTKRDWTYREATEGTEDGVSVAAALHSGGWLALRGHVEEIARKASGFDTATDIGLTVDQADRDSTRAGIDVEITPGDKVGLVLAYLRRHDDFPDRPNRVPGAANTANGLLKANYDSYTAEIDFTPSPRGNVSFYYTWEKNLSVTQTGATIASNILRFGGSDKTNTFGLNGRIVLMPDRWTVDVEARRQKLDSLMDVTGDPNGSFSVARATLGGIRDISDYGDTEYTTAVAKLSYHPATAVTFSTGYAYEKYGYLDAFSWGLLVYPQVGTGFYLKADDRSYHANVVFATMTYRF